MRPWRLSANPAPARRPIGRAVVGLIEATAGEIRFDGKLMGRGRNIRSNDIRGRIQLVFQEPAESLNPRIRVGETMAEPLRYLGLSRADREARVRDVVARLGLGERVLDQFPAELSAGQQQRVGIGRAIVTRPQLIVLDEPTSALDPTARAEIVDLLRRLQRELGTAYLFISHDLSTVRFLSHRVAVLYLGKIVEEADSEELFARPLHPYSAGLLASVLLPDPALKRSSAITLEGEIPSPIDLPAGCSLAGRCPLADAHCREHAARCDRSRAAACSSAAIITTRSRPSTRPSIISPVSRRNRRRFSALEQVERTRSAKRMARRRMTDTF